MKNYEVDTENRKEEILVPEEDLINPLASPCAGAPAVKYRYVNKETSSPGEVKGLIDIFYIN